MTILFVLAFSGKAALPTGDFAVNPTNRAEVRAFFNAVYHASDDVPMNSSADVLACFPGTNSFAFQEAVLRRINWFRAMAGVPASITFSEAFSQDAQRAALIMSAQGTWSHTPPNSWACWSEAGSNAAYNANLIIDTSGPDAITSYIDDFGSENRAVGHRRLLFYPQTQMMGTGDLPSQGGHPAANATWVVDDNLGTSRPPTRQPEVAWPPAGFVPYPVVFRRWSFSYPSASFANTTVAMRSNGVSIAVTKEQVLNLYGENTVVWVPAGLDPNPGGYHWPRPTSDITYTVSLTNVIIRGQPSNFVYSVTVFDPDVSGAGEVSTTVSGATSPEIGAETPYAIQPVSYATRYEWRASEKVSFVLNDGAEAGLTNFTATTSPGYAVVLAGAGVQGTKAFHLVQPLPLTRQTLALKAIVVPAANAVLRFKSKLGFSGDAQFARVQGSTDAGTSWADLYVQQGSGGSGETSFSSREVALADFVGRSLQLRFTYDFVGGGFYSLTTANAGWLIDDVVMSNCWALVEAGNGTVSDTNFVFRPDALTNYWLEARGLMFDSFGLSWGPGLTVVPRIAPRLVSPVCNGTHMSMDVVLGGAMLSDLQLEKATAVKGTWNVDGQAVLDTNPVSGRPRYTTEVGANESWYFRLKVP